MRKYNTPYIYDIKSSHYENEISEFLTSHNINHITSDRIQIKPLELDIYLPDHKIAIEFNGDYWHSSKFKDKFYHQNKSLLCSEKGIRLIHIFEFEYNNNKKIILDYLLEMIYNKYMTKNCIHSGSDKYVLQDFSKDSTNLSGYELIKISKPNLLYNNIYGSGFRLWKLYK